MAVKNGLSGAFALCQNVVVEQKHGNVFARVNHGVLLGILHNFLNVTRNHVQVY